MNSLLTSLTLLCLIAWASDLAAPGLALPALVLTGH